jgi:hypothetical protein
MDYESVTDEDWMLRKRVAPLVYVGSSDTLDYLSRVPIDFHLNRV